MRYIHDKGSGRIALAAVAAIIAMLEPGPGFTQQQSDGSDCQAPAMGNKNSGASGQKQAPSQPSESKDLSNCGGVINPPTTGDTGMVKPAPKEGKTPVIPPSTQQDDQQNGQAQPK